MGSAVGSGMVPELLVLFWRAPHQFALVARGETEPQLLSCLPTIGGLFFSVVQPGVVYGWDGWVCLSSHVGRIF